VTTFGTAGSTSRELDDVVAHPTPGREARCSAVVVGPGIVGAEPRDDNQQPGRQLHDLSYQFVPAPLQVLDLGIGRGAGRPGLAVGPIAQVLGLGCSPGQGACHLQLKVAAGLGQLRCQHLAPVLVQRVHQAHLDPAWARASGANASSVTAAWAQAVERCLPPPLVMLVQQGPLRPVPRDNGGRFDVDLLPDQVGQVEQVL